MKLHKECDHNRLIQYGFNKYGSKYTLNLPLYKYKTKPVIELRILVSIEKEENRYVEYEVVECSNENIYIPFYNAEYPGIENNHVLQKVQRKFNEEIRRIVASKIVEEE